MSGTPSPTADNSTSANPTTGRGGGGRGRGRNRNRGGRGNQGSQGRGGGKSGRPKFKGSTDDMNGHVFECFGEHDDKRQYTKTIEALKGYAKKHLSFPEDLAPLFGDDMKTPTISPPAEPTTAVGATPSKIDEMIWTEQVKEYVKRLRALTGNLTNLHAVIWGQCSEAMRSKLRSLDQYTQRTEANDCAWLLKEVKAVTLQFDERKYGFLSILDARTSLMTCKQGGSQSIDDFLEELKGWANAIEYFGGEISENYKLVPETATDGTVRDEPTRKTLAKDRTMATLFIRGVDPRRYGTLVTDLANQYAMGTDHYPADLTAAYGMVVNYINPAANNPRPPTQPSATHDVSAMTFAQHTSVAGDNGIVHDGVLCYACQRHGHYSSNCPGGGTPSTTTGTTLVQYGYMLAHSHAEIDPNWILLDSQSTISVFKNPHMLTEIRKSDRTLRALTNGGHQDSDMIGNFPNLGEVWFNRNSIANILSLSEVRKICRVTMDTATESALLVHRLDGSIMRFVEHPSGLYVYDATDHNVTSPTVTDYTMLSTVAGQKAMFSRRQIEAADRARTLYRKLGRPSEADFQTILRKNFLRNCPVTPDDARRALTIYGPDIATLKGKTTRQPAAHRTPTFALVPIPAPVLEHHQQVTLCVDFFFVQGLPFYHTISRDIGFRTVAPVPDRYKSTILRETNAVVSLYTNRGLDIRAIHSDGEFACIRDDVHPIDMNIAPPDSHVGEVERSIRTLKERARSTVHGLPFRRLPKLLVTHVIADAVRCLNQFPSANGISNTMSPATIVTGQPLPDFNALRLELGTYVQVFEDHTPTNTPRARTMGAIALTPTGNAQGDYYFLSLATGARISRHSWTELPITDIAISRVKAIAMNEGQPLLQSSGLVVEWRPGHLVDDDAYDADFQPAQIAAPDDDFILPRDFDPIDDTELADLAADFIPYAPAPNLPVADQGAHDNDNDNDPNDTDPNENGGNNDNNPNDTDPNDNGGNDDDPNGGDNGDNDDDYDNNPNDNDNDNDDADYDVHQQVSDDEAQGAPGQDDYDGAEEHQDTEHEDEEAQGAPGRGGYEGAEEPPPQDETIVETVNEDEGDETEEEHGHHVPPHRSEYNLRNRNNRRPATRFRGAMDKPFSAQSYDPPVQLLQTEERPTNDGVRPRTIDETKKFIFGHIMTQMSEKKGLKKHGKAAEEALLQEFAQLEDLSVFEALDPRKLTDKQKKGALRAINLLKEKRDGRLKGRTVADGRPQRSLYDKSETASPTVSTDALMISIIVDAHEGRDVATADVAGAYLKADMDDFVVMKFTGVSVDIMCRMNPRYRKYVINERGGKALYVRLAKALYGCVKSALLWYDLFTSHLVHMGFELNPYDQCVANCVIDGKQCTIVWYVDDTKVSHMDPHIVSKIITGIEERFQKMTVTRGKEHTFLGMKIRFTGEGTAVVNMREYLEEAIRESEMDITKTAATPARKNLFDVDESSTALGKHEGEIFHRVVAKLLYVSIRARMDILLAVIFLCTRVSKCNLQDAGKLRRLLEYLNGSLDQELTLGADDMTKLRSWVDAAYAVHPDMKSHTGGVMSFGIGGFLCKSMKQKLNTKSSTEAELVGASDYLPNTMWVKMFLEAQGYSITENYFEQDNESAIRLEKNGRKSAGPKSRHINVRYFFIKDRTEALGIQIRHCPTLQMLGDFFTKPLQGALFRRFRDVILGYKHVDSLSSGPGSPVEERVGGGILKRTDDDKTEVERANEEKNEASLRDNERVAQDKTSTAVTWAEVVGKRRRTKKVFCDHNRKTIQ